MIMITGMINIQVRTRYLEIWESKEPLKGLPLNIRLDKTTFEVINTEFTKYTFNYTTFEGDKKVFSIKINNNTGEFVQL